MYQFLGATQLWNSEESLTLSGEQGIGSSGSQGSGEEQGTSSWDSHILQTGTSMIRTWTVCINEGLHIP